LKLNGTVSVLVQLPHEASWGALASGYTGVQQPYTTPTGVYKTSKWEFSDHASVAGRLADHLVDRVMLSRKRYIGPIAHLRAKTAFVRPCVGNAGQVLVQFEALYLQEARGWWQFAEADFEPTAD
jgi:hypothetical protein